MLVGLRDVFLNTSSRYYALLLHYNSAILLGVLFAFIYALFRIPVLHSGDAAKYLSYAEQSELWGIPTHIAYIVSIFLAVKALMPWGLTGTSAAEFVSALWAASGVAIVYIFCREYCKLRNGAALFAAALLGLSASYALFATVVQYSSMQVAFFLFALMAAVYNRPFSGGVFLSISVLTTPPAVFCYPALLVLFRSWKNAILFTATSGSIALAISFIKAHEYYFGGRGIFYEAQSQLFKRSWSQAPEILHSIGLQFSREWSVVLILSLIGIYPTVRRYPRFALSTAILVSVHLIYFSHYMYYRGFYLPFYPILAILAGVAIHFGLDGVRKHHERYKRLFIFAGMLLLVVYGVGQTVSYTKRVIAETNKSSTRSLEWIQKIDTLMGNEDWLFARFGESMRRGYYTYGYAYRGKYIWDDLIPGMNSSHTAEKLKKANRTGNIFVHPRAFSSLESITKRYQIDVEFKKTENGHQFALIPKGGFQ